MFTLLLQHGPGPVKPDPNEVRRLHGLARQMADKKLEKLRDELAKEHGKDQELVQQLEDYALCWLEAD